MQYHLRRDCSFYHEGGEVSNQVVLSVYQHPGFLLLPSRLFKRVFVRKQRIEVKVEVGLRTG